MKVSCNTVFTVVSFQLLFEVTLVKLYQVAVSCRRMPVGRVGSMHTSLYKLHFFNISAFWLM